MKLFKKCKTALLFNDEPTDDVDSNFFYFSNCNVDSSILVLSKTQKILLTPKMNEKKAKASCKLKVIAYDSKNIRKLLKKHAKGKIGIDFSSVSHARFLRLKKMFKNNLVNISEELTNSRLSKTKQEIQKIKNSVKIAKQILKEIEKSLSPSKTEKQIEKELLLLCIKHEVTPSFPPIVASGKNSANPHHTPSNKKLGKSIVLIDFGVKYKNYCSDLTRCFFLAECKKEKKKYKEAQQILNKIKRHLSKIKTAGHLSEYADSLTIEGGWGKMVHAIGHGVGLEVHEAPALYSKSKEKLKSGVVLAIEPGWYGNNFGVRYEQNLLITKTGAKLF